MKPTDVLREARKLIEKGWTQGCFARDKCGVPIEPESVTAVTWCALGALRRARAALHYDGFKASRYLFMANRHYSVAAFNDSPKTTKADVLNLFDKAIALADAECPAS